MWQIQIFNKLINEVVCLTRIDIKIDINFTLTKELLEFLRISIMQNQT